MADKPSTKNSVINLMLSHLSYNVPASTDQAKNLELMTKPSAYFFFLSFLLAIQ